MMLESEEEWELPEIAYPKSHGFLKYLATWNWDCILPTGITQIGLKHP